MADHERTLSEEEQAVILALLAQDFPGVDELRAQVPEVIVLRRCGCGCATRDLGPGTARRSDASPVRDGVLVSASVTGCGDGVLLFVKDGYLSCLEVYSLDDDPAPLPRVQDLVIDPVDTRE
ncbi:hypothetical protein ACWENQ_09975 [Nonomuraea sp. NPDC004354]